MMIEDRYNTYLLQGHFSVIFNVVSYFDIKFNFGCYMDFFLDNMDFIWILILLSEKSVR